MVIDNIRLKISEDDLQAVIDKNLPGDKKLSDVKVRLDGDNILLSGKYEVPVVGSMGIKVSLQPEVKDTATFVLHIDFMGLGGMVTGLILKFLDSIIRDFSFVRRENNSLFIKLDELLKYLKINGNIVVKQLSVVDELLILEGKGSCSL